MTRAIEAITSVVRSLVDDEPKPPLHVGEVMALWTALASFQEAHYLYEAGLNTTQDPDLKQAVQGALDASKKDSKMIKDFLKKEGVPLPAVSEEKPKSNPNDIPPGVKMTDSELANTISIKLAAVISFCGTSIAQCIRSDVGIMFLEVQAEVLKLNATFKEQMKKKGWLKIPPYYYPSGRPDQS
ncbi:DUF3231 family protein [Halobacillus amylolyticus]|uniref:DUF3231 family protein n=1 Tax=Halobacillus amylolyticus TaxID=2932259 RepID=A0ABY4H9L0_9BACI|nr:DUF3231 family protein [Halobacillus amylolyticus]UOR11384.1 DUF3231 family protein [Halobacillus amylolyticus]